MVAGFKLDNLSFCVPVWFLSSWTHIYDLTEALIVAISQKRPSESSKNPTNALNLCYQHMALFCESGESGAGHYVIQDEDGSHSHGISSVWVGCILSLCVFVCVAMQQLKFLTCG